jgi:hypothetical protein
MVAVLTLLLGLLAESFASKVRHADCWLGWWLVGKLFVCGRVDRNSCDGEEKKLDVEAVLYTEDRGSLSTMTCPLRKCVMLYR